MYSLADVLAVADIHPFYSPNVQYPPDAQALRLVREQAAGTTPADASRLKARPLLWKKDL